MLLPKSTLEQIESYTVINEKVCGTYADVNDIITLHFKQWWKRDRVILISRNTVDIDNESKTFHHRSSPEAMQLLTQLERYMASTFSDSPTKQKTAQILSIIPKETI